MRRKINDGDLTGIKMDRLRHSRFDLDQEPRREEGYYRRSPNSLSGPYNENRGRRSAEGTSNNWESSPFEDGRMSSWNHRKGWDNYYDRSYDRGFRSHGGSQIGHDLGDVAGHRGKGPKGYKRSDESIYQDVCDMLSSSADVDATDIEVSVKDGCVYLNGRVQDRQMKKMAEYEVENISGVRDVQNLLSLSAKGEDLH
ncbi:BON domain-containing protein [Peredibacter starrii]|uniref:BON domain-containing protein n=1 Tax=Peredibacter starrii TaxID=28202 RepID=A0AAX4HUJ8_9BACT|nr:BON domain-containing protein [Peredibacter starrii]WPU66962.1 BON domain-containing protein [Peredibacter starrii]